MWYDSLKYVLVYVPFHISLANLSQTKSRPLSFACGRRSHTFFARNIFRPLTGTGGGLDRPRPSESVKDLWVGLSRPSESVKDLWVGLSRPLESA
jgi:hypothetical protein